MKTECIHEAKPRRIMSGMASLSGDEGFVGSLSAMSVSTSSPSSPIDGVVGALKRCDADWEGALEDSCSVLPACMSWRVLISFFSASQIPQSTSGKSERGSDQTSSASGGWCVAATLGRLNLELNLVLRASSIPCSVG